MPRMQSGKGYDHCHSPREECVRFVLNVIGRGAIGIDGMTCYSFLSVCASLLELLVPLLCHQLGDEVRPSAWKGGAIDDVSCRIEIRSGPRGGANPHLGCCDARNHRCGAVRPLAKETPTPSVGSKGPALCRTTPQFRERVVFCFRFRANDWLSIGDKDERLLREF